ncbi:Bifunctional phosphoribosylaminoimidazolecarboxamide formyltransferase/IMP cyclohydrolase PurH [Balamuthia mandrillaris]
MKRALISVSNKSGLGEFCLSLEKLGFELLSTGGTYTAIEQAGVKNVRKVSEVTQFPEILGGRVKTLHPAIHGGVLAKRTEEHLSELAKHNISPIDVVVCNLYPFVETIKNTKATEEEVIEQIDIGGVALLRASAKNFESVLVLTDPSDYPKVLAALERPDGVSKEERRRYALKAFRHTATYDSAISAWLTQQVGQVESTTSKGAEEEEQNKGEQEEIFPPVLALSADKAQQLRYGENPHQQGALYRWIGTEAPFEQLQGKELSYNNLLDMEIAWGVPQDFVEGEDTAACVCIVKHNTPCGVAAHPTNLKTAYEQALASDPVSAFGSIIGVNKEVDLEFVETIGSLFLEVLMAPSFTEEALQWLHIKKKNCRVMLYKGQARRAGAPQERLEIRSVMGGLLVQTPDRSGGPEQRSQWKVVTKKQPTEEEWRALEFSWKVIRSVKSNAIVLVQGTRTVGIGNGQPNRIDAVRHAATRAGEQAKGSVMSSDAFFPFPDGVQEAAKYGIACVIQPGGSIRDEEVIAAADELGLAMVFTGERHFKH